MKREREYDDDDDDNVSETRRILNECLVHTSRDGDVELVQPLLENPLVDPMDNTNGYALSEAAWRGHTDVVRLFLEHPRVILNDYWKKRLVLVAASINSADLMRLLIADPRFDPSSDQNFAVRWSASHGYLQVMRVLLADHRVDGSCALAGATHTCAHVLAGDPRFGIQNNWQFYNRMRPKLTQEYDDMLARCVTMAWVAKQLCTWSDIVQPLTERWRAGFFE